MIAKSKIWISKSKSGLSNQMQPMCTYFLFVWKRVPLLHPPSPWVEHLTYVSCLFSELKNIPKFNFDQESLATWHLNHYYFILLLFSFIYRFLCYFNKPSTLIFTSSNEANMVAWNRNFLGFNIEKT